MFSLTFLCYLNKTSNLDAEETNRCPVQYSYSLELLLEFISWALKLGFRIFLNLTVQPIPTTWHAESKLFAIPRLVC